MSQKQNGHEQRDGDDELVGDFILDGDDADVSSVETETRKVVDQILIGNINRRWDSAMGVLPEEIKEAVKMSLRRQRLTGRNGTEERMGYIEVVANAQKPAGALNIKTATASGPFQGIEEDMIKAGCDEKIRKRFWSYLLTQS